MKFQVPQFIEIEDKIFGPFTFKQFVYLIGGGGLSFILYSIFPLFIAILFIAPVIALALSLAFYKMNNKPFIEVLENAFRFTVGKKLYIWKKMPKKTIKKETKKEEPTYIPKLSDSKLKELSWSLGVKDTTK